MTWTISFNIKFYTDGPSSQKNDSTTPRYSITLQNAYLPVFVFVGRLVA